VPEGDAAPWNTASRPPSELRLDLTEEAAQLFRRRIRVTVSGLVIGLAFIGVGVYEVGVLAPRGPSLTYAVAFLLLILGIAVAFVSLNSGLINPVRAIRGTSTEISFERRRGRTLAWRWTDPAFRLDVDDRSVDPDYRPGGEPPIYFEGPSPVYGSLTSTGLRRLTDAARAQGALVTERVREDRTRRGTSRVRRVAIRPPPIR
jgi:hypothetical protein